MRLVKNISWTVLSRFGTQGFAVISNVLLARHLGREGFGEYAFISSVVLIGNAFTTFGTDMVLIRRLAVEDGKYLLADGLSLQLLFSLVYIAGVFATGIFVTVPASLEIYIFSLLPLSFYSIFTIFLRGYREMKVFSIYQVFAAFLQFLVVIAAWLINAEITTLAALMLAVHFLLAFIAFNSQSLQIGFARVSLPRTLTLLKECAPMAAIGTVRLLYEKITITLLPSLAGLSLTGIFSASLRVMEAGKLGHLSAFTAIYPEMTRDGDFGTRLKGLRPLLILAGLISFALSLFAGPIIRILFGLEFLPSIFPLQILAWVILPYVLVTYTSLGLVAAGAEKLVLFPLLISLAVLLFLFYVLMPLFGLAGSAIAILFAETIHAALLWRQWRFHALSKLP